MNWLSSPSYHENGYEGKVYIFQLCSLLELHGLLEQVIEMQHKIFAFRSTPDFHAKILESAKMKGISGSDFVRLAVRDALDKQKAGGSV